MTISLIGSTGGANTSSDDVVDLTPYSLTQNDLVVVHLCRRATSNTTPAITTAGYTAAYANVYSNSTNDSNLRSFYKIMGATPDTDVTITSTGFSNTQAYAVQIFRGVDTTTPLGGVTPTTATTTGATAADAPSITPTTAGSWIVAVGGLADATGGTGSTTFTVPANMTNMIVGDNDRAKVGAALKTDWTSGAFDPAAFGGGSTAAGNGSSAATFVLKPAAGGGSAQNVTAPLYTNTNSFLSGTVSSVKALSAPFYTDTNSFFGGTVTTTKSLTAPLYNNSNTFYSGTLTETYSVTGSLFENSQAFYSAVVSTVNDVDAPLLSNENTFYSGTIGNGLQIQAPLLDSTATFYSGTVSIETPAKEISQDNLIHNFQTWFSPSVTNKNPPKVSLEFRVGRFLK